MHVVVLAPVRIAHLGKHEHEVSLHLRREASSDHATGASTTNESLDTLRVRNEHGLRTAASAGMESPRLDPRHKHQAQADSAISPRLAFNYFKAIKI